MKHIWSLFFCREGTLARCSGDFDCRCDLQADGAGDESPQNVADHDASDTATGCLKRCDTTHFHHSQNLFKNEGRGRGGMELWLPIARSHCRHRSRTKTRLRSHQCLNVLWHPFEQALTGSFLHPCTGFVLPPRANSAWLEPIGFSKFCRAPAAADSQLGVSKPMTPVCWRRASSTN